MSEERDELSENRWALISFDRVIVTDVPYERCVAELAFIPEDQRDKGLTIVTAEAAARLKR